MSDIIYGGKKRRFHADSNKKDVSDQNVGKVNLGQAWIKANPNIIRTALASYPYYGKTVLMTKEEFSENSSTRQSKKVRERDLPA